MATKTNKGKQVKNNSVKISTTSSDNEFGKLIKLVIIVTLIFLVFYVITIFVNKKEEKKKTETPATIQYDEILIGNILNQQNETYYVLIQDKDDLNVPIYNAYISVYKKLSDTDRVYTATLNNPLNSRFVGEDVVFNVDNVKDLRFNKTAFIKVEKGKITAYYEEDNIKKILLELSKSKEETEE